MTWPPSMVHLLEHREADVHQRRAGDLRFAPTFGLMALPQSTTLTSFSDLDVAGLGVDLDLGAGAGEQPERRDLRALAGSRGWATHSRA